MNTKNQSHEEIMLSKDEYVEMELDNKDKIKKHIPDVLDSLQFSRFHLMIIITLGISWVLDGYEVSLLSVLSGILKNILLMTDAEIGLAGSLYLTGCVIGSLFFGFMANKFGRKRLFSITLFIYVVSILSTSFSVNKYMFFVSRFFTGISVGGEYSCIFAAIDELLPKHIRGRADLIIDGTWHLGSTIAAISSYASLTYFGSNQEIVMRALFVVGVIVAFPVIFMRRHIPESPRWLVNKGRYQEALSILEKIELKCKNKYFNICDFNTGDKDAERTQLINKRINSGNKLINEDVKDISIPEILKTLFMRHRTRFFYSLVLMASQAFFFNGIFYSYTLVLQTFYHIPKESVGLYLIPLSIASFAGPLVLGKFFDSWSRRGMITLTFSLSGLFLCLTAMNFKSETFGFSIQQTLWFITFFIASPAASSAHLTVSEIFPIEMRSQAMAIFFSFGLGIGGVISPYLFGSFIREDNKITIFYSYIAASCVMIFAAIFGYFYGVDCENKSLEEIAENMRDEQKPNCNYN